MLFPVNTSVVMVGDSLMRYQYLSLTFYPQPQHPGVNSRVPYAGDATHVIWQDPSSYKPLFHGPPYLPGMEVQGTKVASKKVASVADTVSEVLVAVLVSLRALALLHQTHHWLSDGPEYYADHLLFERLYNETVEEIDAIGERDKEECNNYLRYLSSKTSTAIQE